MIGGGGKSGSGGKGLGKGGMKRHRYVNGATIAETCDLRLRGHRVAEEKKGTTRPTPYIDTLTFWALEGDTLVHMLTTA